ncbi:LysR family transcriptional regulator [Achromobacter pestifer]|uniref:HTH-type transcriptional regulator GltC n=1 Tax=Achromobacter pestifer TaxID=1353889 RepID=A0A6S6YVK2_9BURK|nr:LysR family transcriptional regulator [Achromobacter pestifer]CAB3646945.1 HTH-type transcriptional regulator GltC [Achromobacter pestifer]
MDLRHLRCFMVVAEELHFSRAAERLHIEPSPLSRTIKELEEDLGILLFKRDRRGTHLTHPGQVFLGEVRRVFMALDHAKKSVKAAASGYRSTLRIALSDGVAQPRLASILARCREEEPEVEVRLVEVPLAVQLRGLRDDTFDAGFSRSADVGDAIIAQPVWFDPLVVAVPTRHPLLSHKEIPLEELLRYPLVLCHPEVCVGCARQVQRILRMSDVEPMVAEHVTSTDMMLTLVAAGYGLGFATTSHIAVCKHPEVVARPLAVEGSALTTYLLTPETASSPQLGGFIERVMESAENSIDL